MDTLPDGNWNHDAVKGSIFECFFDADADTILMVSPERSEDGHFLVSHAIHAPDTEGHRFVYSISLSNDKAAICAHFEIRRTTRTTNDAASDLSITRPPTNSCSTLGVFQIQLNDSFSLL